MATVAAAAIVAKARRNVILHLMQSNSVGPGAAVEWVPDRRIERRALERFVERGVIVATADHRYYLDLPAYVAWRKSTRRRVALALAGLAAVGAAVAALA